MPAAWSPGVALDGTATANGTTAADPGATVNFSTTEIQLLAATEVAFEGSTLNRTLSAKECCTPKVGLCK